MSDIDLCQDMSSVRLSICIATYNRGIYISRTLDSILSQLVSGVEIIVVDGASPDNTLEVMAEYASKHLEIHYYREQENSGVDRDFDKAVSYAHGGYCWLMTDDDLLKSGAIQQVLAAIDGGSDLIVVNSEVKNIDLSETLEERKLKLLSDITYSADEQGKFFTDTASYLSFIGCVVVKRTLWVSRDRASYYGTLFIHVGVIFQSPLFSSTMVISDPLIVIRYGNAMWTPRGFEIWMFKWPNLIWSFPDFSDREKQKICSVEPWRSVKTLFLYRAMGSYTSAEFYRIYPLNIDRIERIVAQGISFFPAKLANFIMILYVSLRAEDLRVTLYDLLHSPHSMATSRFLARVIMKIKGIN